MKKPILLIVVAVALVGLGNNGCEPPQNPPPCDQRQSMENVQHAFPYAELQTVPGHDYEWIVKEPNGAIYYAKDYGQYPTNVPVTNLLWRGKIDLEVREIK